MMVLGIHITEHALCAALVRWQKDDVELLESFNFPLSLESPELDIQVKTKELIQKYPPSHYHFAVVLPQHLVSVHDLKFPFKEKFKINKALPFELEEKTPFPENDMVYSFKVCSHTNSSSHVLSFVSSKKRILEFLELLKPIEPSVLTPESSALSNVFEDWKMGASKIPSSAPVDQLKIFLGFKNSTALVSAQNRIILSYNLNWGFEEAVQNISEKYKRNKDQSLKYFFENAVITHEELNKTLALSKIMRKSFKSLVHQIHLLLIYLKGAGCGSVKEISLLGPGSKIQNLSYHLYSALKIPVHKLNSYEKYPVPLEYLTAFGGALEAFKRPKNPAVNLAFTNNTETVKMTQKKVTLLKTIFAAGILFFSYMALRNWQVKNMISETNTQFSSYARKIAGLKTRSISVKNVKKFLKQKQSKQQKHKKFQSLGQLTAPLSVLENLSLSLDQSRKWGVHIHSLEVSGPQVILQGNISPQHFTRLKTALKPLADKGIVSEKPIKQKKESQKDIAKQINELSEIMDNTETKKFHLAFKFKNWSSY